MVWTESPLPSSSSAVESSFSSFPLSGPASSHSGGATLSTTAVLKLWACPQPPSFPLYSPGSRPRRLSLLLLCHSTGWLSVRIHDPKKTLFKILKVSEKNAGYVPTFPIASFFLGPHHFCSIIMRWLREGRDKGPRTTHVHTHTQNRLWEISRQLPTTC